MKYVSQLAARLWHSIHAIANTPVMSFTEIRAVYEGFCDLTHFLWAHKMRVLVYTLSISAGIGILWASSKYPGWALSRMVSRSSVILVEVESATPDFNSPWQRTDTLWGHGTGSIINGHRILTAAHVVTDATKITVTRSDMDSAFVAEVSAISHELDLAILTVVDSCFFEGSTPLEFQELSHRDDDLVTYGFPGDDRKFRYLIGRITDVRREPYCVSNLYNLEYVLEVPGEPGFSGGPVTWFGRMTGVLVAIRDDRAASYVVPVQVVRHFLSDIEDGRVDGTQTLIGSWQPMRNPQLRAYYGLTRDQTGVLVTNALKGDADEPLIHRRDVLLAVDGCKVGNNGAVAVEPDSWVSFEYLIDRKQLGDTVTVELMRDRRQVNVDVPLSGPRKEQTRLVRYSNDEMPNYLVIGGFVFTPLTRNFIYDSDISSVEWPTRRYLYDLSELQKTPGESRNEVIVLVRLLPDSTTIGYEDCLAQVVTSVDGRRIANMNALVEAFDKPKCEFHRITLEPGNKEIIFSRTQLGDRQQSILEKFDIPADRSLDLRIAVSEK